MNRGKGTTGTTKSGGRSLVQALAKKIDQCEEISMLLPETSASLSIKPPGPIFPVQVLPHAYPGLLPENEATRVRSRHYPGYHRPLPFEWAITEGLAVEALSTSYATW